ncbi:MAG: hypothetical protein ABGX22_23295 [Pirellulaceae bacterium]
MTNNLHSNLHNVWKRQQWLHRLGGLLIFLGWAILLLLLGIGVDVLFNLPGLARGAMSLALLAFALHKAWRLAWHRLKSFDPAHTALQVEEHFGDLQSLLVTGVQFGEGQDIEGSADLREVACRQAEEKISELPTHETVRFGGLRKPAVLAAVLVALLAAFAAINTPFFTAAMSRFMTPWAAVSYPTRTQIELADEAIFVKEGEPLVVAATIKGEIPETAVIALRTGDGEPRRRKLPITDGVCQYQVGAAFRGFEYALTAGDAETEWQKVTVISAPKIKRARTSVRYPSYTRKAADSSEALTLTLPEGSVVDWELDLDQAVQKATLECEGEAPVSMTVSPDGLSVRASYVVNSSKAYSFGWVEKEQGYTFESPHHFLQVAPDKAPRVDIVTPAEDLYAIVGRQIDLTFLARDDHGISAATIIHRLNNGEEHRVALPADSLKTGEVTQTNWDYRNHAKNLKVGDILRIGVEVKDHFPSKDGPNVARSRLRRITFLTEEDYLEQLAKRKSRLVRKLRTIYRQERASHDVVSQLSPDSGSFQQTCMLEAVRQNLVQERLAVVTDRIGFLLDDLAANKIAAETDVIALQMLRQQLQGISTEPVEAAAVQLSRLAQAADGEPLDASAAAQSINVASRQIASLVLQLGVNDATEVLARELQTVIQTQSALRLETLDARGGEGRIPTDSLAEQQKVLGGELTQLFTELLEDPDYTGSPMAALRLSRVVKDLRVAGVETDMAKATALIKAKDHAGAVSLQEKSLDTLKGTIYRLKAGAELVALRKARQQVEAVLMQQQNLNARASASKTDFTRESNDLHKAQLALYRELRSVVLPKIPMPMQSMFDSEFPGDVELQSLFGNALTTLNQAATAIAGKQQQSAVDHQKRAVADMTQLVDIIEQRKKELLRLGDVFTLALKIDARRLRVKDIIMRQSAIQEQAEDALDAGAQVGYLAEQQKQLKDEVRSLCRQIEATLKKGGFAGYAAALLEPLQLSEKAMAQSVALFSKNKAEESLEHQDVIVAQLNSCMGIMASEMGTLGKVTRIMQEGDMVRSISRIFGDVEAQQMDIVKDAKGASGEQLARLTLEQKNLATCLTDLMGSLVGPVENKDMLSLLEFSQSSFGASVLLLQENKAAEAAPHQTEAAELLRESHRDLDSTARRNAYVAEMVDFIYRKSADAMVIFATQKQLCFDAQNDKKITTGELLKRQETVLAEAKVFGDDLFRGTRQGHFRSTARYMGQAVTLLKAGKRDEAIVPMYRAEVAILVERLEFELLMRTLPTIPGRRESQVPDEVKLLLAVLDVVNLQKELTRSFWLAQAEERQELAQAQTELATTLKALVQRSGDHAFLQSAHTRLHQVVTSPGDAAKTDIYTAQREAESFMHGFILQYSGLYLHLFRGNGKKKSPYVELPDDIVMFDTMEKLDKFNVFHKIAVEGDEPEDQESEWDVLGRRDRASLNENFARELPLEYRELLQNYYERLAK